MKLNEDGANWLNVCGLNIPMKPRMVDKRDRISFFDYAFVKVQDEI